jgi:hypothetical protein
LIISGDEIYVLMSGHGRFTAGGLLISVSDVDGFANPGGVDGVPGSCNSGGAFACTGGKLRVNFGFNPSNTARRDADRRWKLAPLNHTPESGVADGRVAKLFLEALTGD